MSDTNGTATEPANDQQTMILQTAFIELSDGRKGQFIGTLLIMPFESGHIQIKSVNFSEPIEVPLTPELAAMAGMLQPELLTTLNDTTNDN